MGVGVGVQESRMHKEHQRDAQPSTITMPHYRSKLEDIHTDTASGGI